MKSFIEPIQIRKGDNRVKINGESPVTDCRIISEDQYQSLIKLSGVDIMSDNEKVFSESLYDLFQRIKSKKIEGRKIEISHTYDPSKEDGRTTLRIYGADTWTIDADYETVDLVTTRAMG